MKNYEPKKVNTTRASYVVHGAGDARDPEYLARTTTAADVLGWIAVVQALPRDALSKWEQRFMESVKDLVTPLEVAANVANEEAALRIFSGRQRVVLFHIMQRVAKRVETSADAHSND